MHAYVAGETAIRAQLARFSRGIRLKAVSYYMVRHMVRAGVHLVFFGTVHNG